MGYIKTLESIPKINIITKIHNITYSFYELKSDSRSRIKNWIVKLSKRYRSAQIQAAVAINKEIVERQDENKYGSGFFNS